MGRIIHSCGLYQTKARDLVACAPDAAGTARRQSADTMEALTALPGVGRKTANLVLGDIFHKPAVVADTHCIRITGRLGLTDGSKDPVQVEKQLRAVLPPEESSDFCHRMVLHGRAVCMPPARLRQVSFEKRLQILPKRIRSNERRRNHGQAAAAVPSPLFLQSCDRRRTLPLPSGGRFLHNWKRLLQNQGTFPLLVHILH